MHVLVTYIHVLLRLSMFVTYTHVHQHLSMCVNTYPCIYQGHGSVRSKPPVCRLQYLTFVTAFFNHDIAMVS